MIVDAVNPKDSTLILNVIGDRYHLVEDGPKFIGICMWMIYFARISFVRLGARGVTDRLS